MFKRLYAVGGIWYVLGGLSVFAMCSMPLLFGLSYLGVPIPEILLKYSLVALLIGGAVCTVVFNSGTMQVVAQNRSTEVLEKLSQQLEERDAGDNRNRRRSVRRQVVQKEVSEEVGIPCAESRDRVASPILENTAHQEGYRCPVTNAVISIRD